MVQNSKWILCVIGLLVPRTISLVCDENKCHNGGQCVEDIQTGSYYCNCNETCYTGPHCDTHRDCGTIPDVKDATVTFSGKTIKNCRTELIYKCKDGYAFSGEKSKTVTCTNNRWRDLPTACNRISCGVPYIDNFGYKASHKGTYLYGDKVEFSCPNERSVERGDAIRVCLANGTWSGKPFDCAAHPGVYIIVVLAFAIPTLLCCVFLPIDFYCQTKQKRKIRRKVTPRSDSRPRAFMLQQISKLRTDTGDNDQVLSVIDRYGNNVNGKDDIKKSKEKHAYDNYAYPENSPEKTNISIVSETQRRPSNANKDNIYSISYSKYDRPRDYRIQPNKKNNGKLNDGYNPSKRRMSSEVNDPSKSRLSPEGRGQSKKRSSSGVQDLSKKLLSHEVYDPSRRHSLYEVNDSSKRLSPSDVHDPKRLSPNDAHDPSKRLSPNIHDPSKRRSSGGVYDPSNRLSPNDAHDPKRLSPNDIYDSSKRRPSGGVYDPSKKLSPNDAQDPKRLSPNDVHDPSKRRPSGGVYDLSKRRPSSGVHDPSMRRPSSEVHNQSMRSSSGEANDQLSNHSSDRSYSYKQMLLLDPDKV